MLILYVSVGDDEFIVCWRESCWMRIKAFYFA